MFLNNNDGITYAILHIIAGLIIIGAVWIMAGVIIDEFNILSNTLVANSEVWGDDTQNAITNLNNIYPKVLWIIVIASFFYGVITAIRKESRGLNG